MKLDPYLWHVQKLSTENGNKEKCKSRDTELLGEILHDMGVGEDSLGNSFKALGPKQKKKK